MMKSLLLSPPAALRQGNARTAVGHVVHDEVLAPVDHVVNVEFFVPVTTRGPQTGRMIYLECFYLESQNVLT
jgi:hypothetical protein